MKIFLVKKLKKTVLAGIVGASAIYSSGCATILGKKAYSIPVDSYPQGKHVQVLDKGRPVYSSNTPFTLVSPLGNHNYEFVCEDQRITRDSFQNNDVTSNLILGPIGIIGCFIDLANGCNYSISENPVYFTTSAPVTPKPKEPEKAPTYGDYLRIKKNN